MSQQRTDKNHKLKKKNNLEYKTERLIQRLDSRLQQLHSIDRRYSTLRLVVFILGIAGVWTSSLYTDPGTSRLVALVSSGAFIGIVALHRRLDRWTSKFSILRDIYKDDLARMRLNWDRLPYKPIQLDTPNQPPIMIDLDLGGRRSLHHLVDLAVSQEGSLRLANWFNQTDPDLAAIQERQQIVQELAPMKRFRNRLLLNLHLVSREQLKGQALVEWLETDFPGKRLSWLLIGSAAWILLNLVLLVLNINGFLPPFWSFSFGLYLVFIFSTAGSLRSLLDSMIDMDRELGKFASLLRYLEAYPFRQSPHLQRLCAPFQDKKNRPSSSLRQFKLLTAAVGVRSNLMTWLVINAILPWDALCAWWAYRLKDRAAVLIPAWLETWYQLEGLCSLANFSGLNPTYAFPVISPEVEDVFKATDLGHPLIPPHQRVCNHFRIQSLGEVNIITGSNMAGKSTFIKTVGVNLSLAYAGGPVCAGSMQSQPLRLHTCIRISDSISDGFSYFYAEVKCLKQLLASLNEADSWPVLYLVDEIFRGTNNRERLLGSQAFTQALIGARGCGLIATHDLELANLAEISPKLRNFHFRDEVSQNRLIFDYILRPGPSPTTNALKIMQMEGLPVPETIPSKTIKPDSSE